MIEDMQTGVMQQSQASSIVQTQVLKRTTHSTNNLLLDDKGRTMISGGLSKQKGRGKHPKQGLCKKEISSKFVKKFSNEEIERPKGKKYRVKGNGDNLLNFNYTSLRETSDYRHKVHRKRRPTFNKEAFLQANCKFVVDQNDEKYMEQTIDPDTLVDWNHIQLVYLPTHENPKCPICLYPPTAAKMTRCGHTYCWSCVLHYLNMSEKSWNRCPICHEAVHEKDLKSVIAIIQKKFSRIDDITMKLMVRSKESLCAVPFPEWEPSNLSFPVWQGQPFNSSSSKLLLANNETVFENILRREKTELTAQLHEALQENSGEDVYISMALQKLEEKIAAYRGTTFEDLPSLLEKNCLAKNQSKSSLEEDSDDNDSKQLSILLGNEKETEIISAFSDDKDEADVTSIVKDTVSVGVTVEENPLISDEELLVQGLDAVSICSGNEADCSSSGSRDGNSDCATNDHKRHQEKQHGFDDYYYFYQVEDGQNIFINSLNARCLIDEYGSLGEGPEKIVGQILDFECFTMTHELRKRFRYLSHLPLSCEFIICELMLRPPILSKHTIQNFMHEFKKRKALRNKKVEDQRKFDMKAEAENSRQHGFIVANDFAPEVHLNLSDINDFPSNLSPEETNDGAAQEHAAEVQSSGPSFAQMLKNPSFANFAPTQPWGKSQPQPQRLFGTNQISRHQNQNMPRESGGDSDGEEMAAPTLREMFCAATETLHFKSENNNNKQSGKRSGKGKKKGAKGTLLFATGAQRKY